MKNSVPRNDIQTSEFSVNSREVKVHAIQTGLISVKENFLDQKGEGLRSKIGYYRHFRAPADKIPTLTGMSLQPHL